MATPTAAAPADGHLTAPNHSTSKDKLQKASDRIKYLYDPAHGPQPSSLRTRSLLRSVRYLAIFIFWRVFRYAKYAAVGALTAAVASTAIGSVLSGAAFVIAPTGIVGGAGAGLIWAMAKFGWRRAKARMDGKGRDGDPRSDERADAEGVEEVKPVRMPRTEPW